MPETAAILAQKHTILISGGHLTPAVATIEYLQKKYPQIRILFVGRVYSQQSERQPAKERETCEKLGIPFFYLDAPKFHRRAWWRNIQELPKVAPAFWEAVQIIRQENVSLFLSFGGYLAVPVAIAAKLLGRLVVTHEQTKTVGLANQFLGHLADRVAISSEASRRFFPGNKVELTGNPIRSSLLREYARRPDWIPDSAKPMLYITGGSQGSQVINHIISQLLPQLTERFVVVHQCGMSENQRYFYDLTAAADELPESRRALYRVREWIDEREVSWIMQHADLAVSRSGANTVQELTINALPAVFIPLPFAHNNEQYKNAEKLAEAGAAMLLEQKDLTPESLLAAIAQASAQRAHMRRRAEKLQAEYPTDGAKKLAQLCVSLLGQS